MHSAKWDGKNRYVTFESGMQDAIQLHIELERDLRHALQNNEFFLVYQPTFDLHNMTPKGVEALIRWEHPVRGIVQPNDFIPLLEETGLDASALTIEITETTLMRNAEETVRRLTAVTELGVKIAIDDFGTGYSS